MAVVENTRKIAGYDIIKEFAVQAGDSPAALQIDAADKIHGRDLIFVVQIRDASGVVVTGDAQAVWDKATGILTVTEPTATFSNDDVITVWARYDNRA